MKRKVIINDIREEIIPVAILIILGYAAIFFFTNKTTTAPDAVKPPAISTNSVSVTAASEQNVSAEKAALPNQKTISASLVKVIATTTQAQTQPAVTPAQAANQTTTPQGEKKPAEEISELKPESEPAGRQIIKAIITEPDGLIPPDYTLKIGVPVRLTINPLDDIEGCMSTILIAGLFEQPFLVKKNQPIVMEFTPRQAGEYYIICVMGVEWGKITVVN